MGVEACCASPTPTSHSSVVYCLWPSSSTTCGLFVHFHLQNGPKKNPKQTQNPPKDVRDVPSTIYPPSESKLRGIKENRIQYTRETGFPAFGTDSFFFFSLSLSLGSFKYRSGCLTLFGVRICISDWRRARNEKKKRSKKGGTIECSIKKKKLGFLGEIGYKFTHSTVGRRVTLPLPEIQFECCERVFFSSVIIKKKNGRKRVKGFRIIRVYNKCVQRVVLIYIYIYL